MRTTLDLDPIVLSVARAKARAEHISLGKAVSALALEGIQREAVPPTASGFPVMNGTPGHVITNELVATYRDE